MNTPATATAPVTPVETNHLARLNTLKKTDPFIHAIFVGWMCGTASRQNMEPSAPQATVAQEVETFLATYEASAAGPSS